MPQTPGYSVCCFAELCLPQMVGSRMVQGMGAPRTPQELNAKADEVMAVFLLWRGIARRGCSVN